MAYATGDLLWRWSSQAQLPQLDTLKTRVAEKSVALGGGVSAAAQRGASAATAFAQTTGGALGARVSSAVNRGASAATAWWQQFMPDPPKYAARQPEAGPPALSALLVALGAAAVSRGLLLPFHLLISTELNGWRTLLSRAASSLALVRLAASFASATPALRAALWAAVVAGLVGVGGGLSDRVGTLILSAVISTFAWSAMPLAQALATAGELSDEQSAARLGALAATNALGASAGVHLCLTLLGATSDGGPAAYVVLLCGAAAAIAACGVVALPSPKPAAAKHTAAAKPAAAAAKPAAAKPAPKPAPKPASEAPPASMAAAVPPRPERPTSRAELWGLLRPLSVFVASVALGAVLVQRHAEALPIAPTDIDRVLDAALRLALQALFARRLTVSLGPRGLSWLGFGTLALGALLAAQPELTEAGLDLGVGLGRHADEDAHPYAVASQLAAHHLMKSGLLLAETGAATLLVRASAACCQPVVWRVLSLVALHLVVTLGPTLLPLFGGADGAWAPWLALSFLPLPLVALAPA